MTASPPPAPFVPTPCPATYERIGPFVYFVFPRKPTPHVMDLLRFHNTRFGCGFGKFALRLAAGFPWETARPELEGAGAVFTAGKVEGLEKYRKREVKKGQVVVGDDITGASLGDFDWTGFPAWAEANFVIKDKGDPSDPDRPPGRIIPFRMNRDQRRLFEVMKRQWKKTGRIRINILKHRQRGISTFIQLFILYVSIHVPGIEAIVTAHRDDAVRAVFRRTKLAEERCPTRLPLKYNSRMELEWQTPHSSAIRIGIAGGDEGFGRGDMRTIYHDSEDAQLNERGVEAAGNICASVPKTRGTMIFKETTAKGLNHFYEGWNRADIDGYENFFIGFLEDETCRLYDVALEDARWAKVPAEWKEDEDRLEDIARQLGVVERDITAALAWRRQTIGTDCSGLPAQFLQEFPAVAEDAFVSTGSHVFPLSIVDPEFKRTTDHEAMNPTPCYVIDRGEDDSSTGSLIEAAGGPLRIWKRPKAGVPYVVSGDVGRGVNVKGDTGDPSALDYTTLRVLSRWPDDEGRYEELACWHGRLDPDKAAGQMDFLCRMYNNALAAPEANHYGLILINFLLKKYRYSNVFRRERIDRGTNMPVTQNPDAQFMEFGWVTGPGGGVTKAQMIEYLHQLVRDRLIILHDPLAWGEMRTFIRAADASMDAENGKHDDVVMALAIAACVLKLHPKVRRVERAEPVVVAPIDGGVHVSGTYFSEKMEQRRIARDRDKRGGGGFK